MTIDFSKKVRNLVIQTNKGLSIMASADISALTTYELKILILQNYFCLFFAVYVTFFDSFITINKRF
jgi:hypothetical protein